MQTLPSRVISDETRSPQYPSNQKRVSKDDLRSISSKTCVSYHDKYMFHGRDGSGQCRQKVLQSSSVAIKGDIVGIRIAGEDHGPGCANDGGLCDGAASKAKYLPTG